MKRYSLTIRKSICLLGAIALLLTGFALLNMPGVALAAEEAGETSQYAAVYQSADGSVTTYTETLSAAVKLAKNDADTIMLLRDVALGPDDYIGSTYRLTIDQGFVLDLNGKVLSTDTGLLRFVNNGKTTESTLTIKNGTLVSAAEGTSQHMICVRYLGSLVLENVQAYCGAYYTDGQIVVNESEVAATSSAVGAVVISNGIGDVTISNSMLCNYGNYSVINVYNTEYADDSATFYIENSHLVTHSGELVFDCANKRTYDVIFRDANTVLTTQGSSAFNTYANVTHFGENTGFEATAETNGDTTRYYYAYPGAGFVFGERTGSGTVAVNGKTYAPVGDGASATLTVTPAAGWYVTGVTDSNGNSYAVDETGGTVEYTHTAGIVKVRASYAQCAALYESADGTVSTYTKTLSAAVKLVTSDSDKVTLLRDVELDGNDTLSNTATYRLDLTQGFILDLNGKVLSADNSLLRFMNKTTNVSTMTFKNGTVVAAVNGDSQHVMGTYNYGNLVLENVKVYCGALYEDGQIVINETEVEKTTKGVGAALICNGSGTMTLTDSLLCSYGNYAALNAYNTDGSTPRTSVAVTNCHLINYGAKPVLGCSDTFGYTIRFTDDNSILSTNSNSTNLAHSRVTVDSVSEYGFVITQIETVGDTIRYHYTQGPAYTVTWRDHDGTVLRSDDNMGEGVVPMYNGATPQRAADSEYSYLFAGWEPQIAAVSGDTAYTAKYYAVPLTYEQITLDMVADADLYRVQGRPYLTASGLYLDFAGAAIEFEAELAGALTMTCTPEISSYIQVFVDGEPVNRPYVAKGETQTVTLVDLIAPGTHMIRIVRDSDVSTAGKHFTVSSLELQGRNVRPTAQRPLYIEFVGDSITSGSSSATEFTGSAMHKATYSYAYLTAQALGADYSMVSRGGCGYFRDSTCPVRGPELYPYYNGFVDEPVPYTAQRKADVVILALGTNDYEPYITDSYEAGEVPYATIQEAAQYMIGQIRQMHGENVKIVIMQNMMKSTWAEELSAAAEAEGVHFLQVTQNREGGNNHPNQAGHQVISGELTAFLNETVLADVRVCDQNDREGVSYPSLRAAVNALEQGQYIRLVEDTQGDAEINADVYIDLGGHTLTGNLSGTGTLYGMDSSGDEYTLPTGRITGNASCKVAGNFKTDVTGAIKRYLAIADDSGYTFHRIYVGLTHMSLKPSVTGVGYKAVFGADEAVQALLAQTETYGFTLWVGDAGEKHTFAKNAAEFVSGKTLSLRLQDFDVANYGETPVYGQVFLKLADGTVIESATYSYTLRELVERVAGNLSAYSAQQLTALQAMITKNAEAMKEWNIDSIRNYTAQ